MGKSLLGKHELALEAIAFQPTHFGKLLENIFQEMRDTGVKSAKGFYDLGFDKLIIKAIEDHTKLVIPKIEIIDTPSIAVAMEFQIDYAKHIFNPTDIKNITINSSTAEKILERLSKIKEDSWVDLKNNKVYGRYKEICSKLILSIGTITDERLTPAMAAAGTLHEIGHAIAYCEFFDRFNTTNQILAAVARSIKTDDIPARKAVFTTAARLLNIRDSALDGLEENEDLTSVSVIMLDASLKNQPMLDSGAYDTTSYEAMADNYAARCGYGRPLIEFIEIIPEYDKRTELAATGLSMRKKGAAVTFGVFSAMAFLLMPALTAVLAATQTAAIYYATMSIIFGGETSKDYTYDGTKIRMKRVKEQLIEYLKDSTVPNDQRKRTLEDLEKIDQIISKTTHAKVALFDRISNFLYAKNKTLKTRIELQRDLEELAHNELFVAAAKLRSIQ